MSYADNDLIIKKPVSVLNKAVNINYRSLFISLGKIALAGSMGDVLSSFEHTLSSLKSINVKSTPEEVAWGLISTALTKSLIELVKDYHGLFAQIQEPSEESINELAERVEYTLNAITVSINSEFFRRPQDFSFLDDFKSAIDFWLAGLGWNKAQQDSFHYRLKSRFIFALNNIWMSNSDEYRVLLDRFNTPFLEATIDERNWSRYIASLQEQANERVFNEVFSLKQVYVPLNGFYTESRKVSEEKNIFNKNKAYKQKLRLKEDLEIYKKSSLSERVVKYGEINDEIDTNEVIELREEKIEVVFDLHKKIHDWVYNFKKDDSLKVISGVPGSGKSSFCKMLASEIASDSKIPVLFIPLQYFNPAIGLFHAIENYVLLNEYLTGNPFDPKFGKKRLLVIFDGLDELSMQGKAAAETAQDFVHEVMRTLDQVNSNRGIQRQVIITGRDLAVQAIKRRLRKPQQIFHLLPYYLTNKEKEAFDDKDNLLDKDLRNVWWKKFGKASGKKYTKLPSNLQKEALRPITREPLLNYLISLSYENYLNNKIRFDDNTTLNEIYNDLLKSVYKREWDDSGQHEAVRHLDESEYFLILEEIALTIWHGNGRTATAKEIYNRCKKNGLTRFFEYFSEGAKKGVVKLLLAFYFREFSKDANGEQTFEFTHKSFGEYLTARRIVRAVEDIHDEIERNQKYPNKGKNIREGLEEWVKICGATEMDEYLFKFIQNEISSRSLDEIEKWQITYGDMLGSSVREAMPMERLGLDNYFQMLQQARNSNIAILAIYHACYLCTNKVLYTEWGDKTAFGTWWKRIQIQKMNAKTTLAGKFLAGLNLSDCKIF